MIDRLKVILLGSMPRILSLLDKNPYSQSYGSFDRKYWHYKIIDFPCGMQQELALPLAYIWKTNFEGNRYYNLPRIRDYLEGILLYHERICHRDGSLDDYFPHERAFGATAYALAALTETVLLTDICPAGSMKALEKSGEFLSTYKETGNVFNHLAIASLALINLYLLTKDDRWRLKSDKLVNELRLRQHKEGWFPEYEGCDLGYQTVTIEFLARRYQKYPSESLFEMLSKNVDFLENFLHPDGSIGGEYGSRNTYNFYPGGFAILSTKMPKAAKILNYFLQSLQNLTCNYLEDDGVFGHLLSSYITVLRSPEIKLSDSLLHSEIRETIRYFKGAGLFVGNSGMLKIFGSISKGGVYKIFKQDRLLYSDTGFVGRLKDDTVFCQNKPRISEGNVTGSLIEIGGSFYKYNDNRLGRIQMVGLRVLSLLFGRFRIYSYLIRILMQRLLIYNRVKLNMVFSRKIELGGGAVEVVDEITLGRHLKLESLKRSTDCVDTHVITSDSFQSVNLLPWEEIKFDSSEPVLKFKKTYIG